MYSLSCYNNESQPKIVGGSGVFLHTSDGRRMFDACSGAAVSCLGHGNQRVIKAISNQLNTGTPYLASATWRNDTTEDLCRELIQGTSGKMQRVYLTGSGSEAMEAAIKISYQYHYELDNKTKRLNFITRRNSYHGNTIGALSISGHVARKRIYTPMLMNNVYDISPCYPYRQQQEDESNIEFVAKKATELEQKFQEIGPDTVIAFIMEPIAGAALGCAPSIPGYLNAMREICHRHGALFILDEVMCGMGRTGYLHAWQAEDIPPDIQTIAKGLGAGYQPIAAMMISKTVERVVVNSNTGFIHGLTFQSMPVQAAAALEVQRIIRQENLLNNVKEQGSLLGKILKETLGDHPNVGDIRGQGLLWALEFIKDKKSKRPFDPKLRVAQRILDLGMTPKFNIVIYPGTGTIDGIEGDHIIIAPPYIITRQDIQYITKVITQVIIEVFLGIHN
ncbi:PLP-dependent transferase [Annulohypoxylon moriforme]|nr:PLP-dependent transferase [Annulohypoxylon moriforme]